MPAKEKARAIFPLPADHKCVYEKGDGKIYCCVECSQTVYRPDPLCHVGLAL